jgi:NAD+ kinase
MSPKTIGLIAHTGKVGAAELVSQLRSEFERAKVEVRMETETAALIGLHDGRTIAQLGAEADLLVVLGGDGTILNVVSRLDTILKPIFGINIGSLGFLTCLNSSAYLEAVRSIVSGKFTLSERVLLSVEITRGAESIHKTIALNDAVISRGEISRLIRLRTRVNGAPLTEFNADGLVVASPTGSTAYSLSAGGPILEPQSGVFVITPICPHVLTNRSVIVGDHSVIEVEASEPDYPVFLTLDGRSPVPLEFGSVVTIRRSEKVLPLAVLPELSFFGVVRQKLKWSGSATAPN